MCVCVGGGVMCECACMGAEEVAQVQIRQCEGQEETADKVLAISKVLLQSML